MNKKKYIYMVCFCLSSRKWDDSHPECGANLIYETGPQGTQQFREQTYVAVQRDSRLQQLDKLEL